MRGNPACITWLQIRYRCVEYGTIGGAICQRRSTRDAVEQYTLDACSTSKEIEDLLSNSGRGREQHRAPVAGRDRQQP